MRPQLRRSIHGRAECSLNLYGNASCPPWRAVIRIRASDAWPDPPKISLRRRLGHDDDDERHAHAHFVRREMACAPWAVIIIIIAAVASTTSILARASTISCARSFPSSPLPSHAGSARSAAEHELVLYARCVRTHRLPGVLLDPGPRPCPDPRCPPLPLSCRQGTSCSTSERIP